MTLVERFLKYVSFDTQSSEETEITPSTPGQMVFARYLKEELETLGLEEITVAGNIPEQPQLHPERGGTAVRAGILCRAAGESGSPCRAGTAYRQVR